MLTFIVTVCLMGTVPKCHDELITLEPLFAQECVLSQPELARWKESSKYAGDEWYIQGFRCVRGQDI